MLSHDKLVLIDGEAYDITSYVKPSDNNLQEYLCTIINNHHKYYGAYPWKVTIPAENWKNTILQCLPNITDFIGMPDIKWYRNIILVKGIIYECFC